jgi:hypothetical protein
MVVEIRNGGGRRRTKKNYSAGFARLKTPTSNSKIWFPERDNSHEVTGYGKEIPDTHRRAPVFQDSSHSWIEFFNSR